MSPGQFSVTRSDGRSHGEVLIEMVCNGEPGRLYTYDELSAALSDGAGRAFTRSEIASLVSRTYSRLLKEHQRALHCVRGSGYRLAPASDHRRLANGRKERADVQLRRGLHTLQNVRWNELDPEARKAHEGTLMVMSAMYEQQRAMTRRQDAVEAAISKLMKG
jgi:hypothetical protein